MSQQLPQTSSQQSSSQQSSATAVPTSNIPITNLQPTQDAALHGNAPMLPASLSGHPNAIRPTCNPGRTGSNVNRSSHPAPIMGNMARAPTGVAVGNGNVTTPVRCRNNNRDMIRAVVPIVDSNLDDNTNNNKQERTGHDVDGRVDQVEHRLDVLTGSLNSLQSLLMERLPLRSSYNNNTDNNTNNNTNNTNHSTDNNNNNNNEIINEYGNEDMMVNDIINACIADDDSKNVENEFGLIPKKTLSG